MRRIAERYLVKYGEQTVGYYDLFDDRGVEYTPALGSPWELGAELKALRLDRKRLGKRQISPFSGLLREEKRVPGRKRIVYREGPLSLERRPKETDECFFVYRRAAKPGEPDYSPLPHDAPHREGPNTPKDMREWASWYDFRKMDDGTYQAELDEAWWWGGGHNDGGTIRREIPEEWFALPYGDFLQRVVCLAAAAHYGFTAGMLLEREGLREFFGFADPDPEA